MPRVDTIQEVVFIFLQMHTLNSFFFFFFFLLWGGVGIFYVCEMFFPSGANFCQHAHWDNVGSAFRVSLPFLL